MTSKLYDYQAIPKSNPLLSFPCMSSAEEQYLLALGGRIGSSSYQNGFHIYDLFEGEWQSDGPSMPELRYGHTCQVHHNGYLYVIGGKRSNGGALNTVDSIDATDINDIQSKQWDTLTDRLSIARDGVVSVIHLDYIFVIGGYGSGYRDAVDVIDTTTNDIHLDSQLVTKLVRPGFGIGSNNILYTFGGDQSNTGVIQYAPLPTAMPTIMPTVTPIVTTTMPTIIPTSMPSILPTNNPTENAVEPKYLTQMYCDNLAANDRLEYDISLDECIGLCEDCKLINYFYFWKTMSDSRCYLFDELCNVKKDETNNNKSVIIYKALGVECNDYPVGWTDSIGDACAYYNRSGWCVNGELMRDELEFIGLMNHGWTAMETCCQCGGGIMLVDDVVLSNDIELITESDILCTWTHEEQSENMYSNTTLREWDNLILHQLCVELNVVDCGYLIDAEFTNPYNYTMYMCNANHLNTGENEFIVEMILDDMNEEHMTFINAFWFSIDTEYYSSEINIKYKPYTDCVQYMNVSNKYNETHRYGVHPCHVLDTFHPTFHPTLDPTLDPTSNPTFYPTFDPTLDPTSNPTSNPILTPTFYPTFDPTLNPTFHPTFHPTLDPTFDPTFDPTLDPTSNPTSNPILTPTFYPTFNPTLNPTYHPTSNPTLAHLTDPSYDHVIESDTVELQSEVWPYFVIAILSVIIIILIIALFYKKRLANEGQMDHQIEMNRNDKKGLSTEIGKPFVAVEGGDSTKPSAPIADDP
eukprot:33644_1